MDPGSCSSRGVFSRRSLNAGQGVASRDAARNRSPGRRAAPPAGHYDPAARSSLHGLRRIMPQTEARPTATNRHGGAPKGARPRVISAFTRVLRRTMGAQGASQAPGPPRRKRVHARLRRTRAGPTDAQRSIRAPVGAPPTPRGGKQFYHPGAIAPRERIGLFDK